MKKFIATMVLVLAAQLGFAQSASGVHRKYQKEVDKVLLATSNVIDGILLGDNDKKLTELVRSMEDQVIRSQRYLARSVKSIDAQLHEDVASVLEQMSPNATDSMYLYLEMDNGQHYYIDWVESLDVPLTNILSALERFADENNARVRASEHLARFETQKELIAYVKSFAASRIKAEQLMRNCVKAFERGDMDAVNAHRISLLSLCDEELRKTDWVDFNGDYGLTKQVVKYYKELEVLLSMDLSSDIGRANDDIRYNGTIRKSTKNSFKKTMAYVFGAGDVLDQKSRKFIKRHLPKAPKD